MNSANNDATTRRFTLFYSFPPSTFFLMILPSIVACRRSSLSPADIVAQVFKVAEHFQFPSIRFKKNYSLVISTVDLIRSSDYTTADEYEIRPVVDLFFFFLFTCPSTQPSLRKKATISLVLCMMIPTIFSSFASYSFSKGFWKRKKKKSK